MNDDKLIQNSMDIILKAGDARLKATESLKALEVFDYEQADLKLKEAYKLIQSAHKIQTDTIQAETRGEKHPTSLLFTHAQDTLMTIYSELNITKRMIKIFQSYEKRIQALES